MANCRAAVLASTPTNFFMPIHLTAFLVLSLQATSVKGQDIRIDNNEVSIETSTGFRQITHDGTPKRLPVVSPEAPQDQVHQMRDAEGDERQQHQEEAESVGDDRE